MKVLFVTLSLLVLCGPSFARLWGDRVEAASNQAMTVPWGIWVLAVCGIIAALMIVCSIVSCNKTSVS